MSKNIDKIYRWLDERLDLEGVLEFFSHKRVPIHRHSIWYYFGGMTLFLFTVQVITGILLLLYYRPSAEAAFESVQFIMSEVKFGWLVRSIHSWSANLMIATLFVHMFTVFLMKAYRKPRELTWITGTLLLFISLFFGFSGYLLPWNRLAYFATKVGTDVAGQVPLMGKFIMKFLRGGEEVSGATLTRFFGFHVAILPGIITLVLGVHLFFIQKQGMSVPPSEEEALQRGKTERYWPFLPNFLLRDMMGWLLVLGILVTLASVFPWELGVKADPLASAPAGIKPEWFFLFMFQTLKYIPSKIFVVDGEVLGILAFGLGGLLWLLVPFLDRFSKEGKRSPLFTTIGVIIIAYILIMTVVAYVAG